MLILHEASISQVIENNYILFFVLDKSHSHFLIHALLIRDAKIKLRSYVLKLHLFSKNTLKYHPIKNKLIIEIIQIFSILNHSIKPR